MNPFRKQEILSKALYAVAIVLLLLNIYFLGANKENRLIEFSGWIVLIIALVYAAYLSKAKKNWEETEG